MNLKSLTDTQLTDQLKDLVADERRITTEVLHHLREVERRMLFAARGYPSLIAYCIHELKYSEAAAYRRIQSMRLLKEIPEIESKIQSGELTLTTVTQTATFFRQVSQTRSTSIEEKRQVLKSIENLSRREVEKVLIARDPDIVQVAQEKLRPTPSGDMHVAMVLDKELMAQIEELKDLLGKQMDLKSLLQILVERELKRCKTRKGITTNQPAQKNSLQQAAQPPVESRRSKSHRPYISRSLKKRLWQRAKGTCEFVDQKTKRCCGETFGLQVEHLKPVALNGSSELENLQLLCANHNRYRAVRSFGPSHMKRYLPTLRDDA